MGTGAILVVFLVVFLLIGIGMVLGYTLKKCDPKTNIKGAYLHIIHGAGAGQVRRITGITVSKPFDPPLDNDSAGFFDVNA